MSSNISPLVGNPSSSGFDEIRILMWLSSACDMRHNFLRMLSCLRTQLEIEKFLMTKAEVIDIGGMIRGRSAPRQVGKSMTNRQLKGGHFSKMRQI